MKFKLETAELFVPDGVPPAEALARTTHMAISAHQDDIEIMAPAAIIECFQQEDKWFTGVVVTNGSGSPRDDLYRDYTDDMMREVRRKEQKKAAIVGEYAAQALLDYPSSAVKDRNDARLAEDLTALLKAARPKVVILHNLADKHDTHVGVAVKAIEAMRRLPETQRPQQVYGGEVWRDLDWMVDSDKVALETSSHENLQAALLGVFDSQIAGGKRYDLASLGRRRAHATYHTSHGTDLTTGQTFAMDLTPLVQDPSLDILGYVMEYINRFAREVSERIGKYA